MEPRPPQAAPEASRRELPRKPYQKPRLHLYGDLGAITRAVLGTRGMDGSGHPNMHFTS
jgi:hypothetical protein